MSEGLLPTKEKQREETDADRLHRKPGTPTPPNIIIHLLKKQGGSTVVWDGWISL